MKIKSILIFITILIAFGISLFLSKTKFYQIAEMNMQGCKSLNISSNCITSQVKYDKWMILSTCRNCDCQKYGHEFLQMDLQTNFIEKIEVENLEKKKLRVSSMSVKNRRLYVVNELNNTALNFEIIQSLRGPILKYNFQFKAKDIFKLGWVLGLSEFEALITVENLENKQNKTSSIFYVIHNPGSKKQRSELVEGIENATLLTGIVESKHHKFIIGSPEENSIIYYKYLWMQGIGFKLTKEKTVNVGSKVGGLDYDEENDQALFVKNSDFYPQYFCWGNIYALKQNNQDNYNNISVELLFQAQKSICSIDSVVVSNGTYYLGSSYDNKYLVCKK